MSALWLGLARERLRLRLGQEAFPRNNPLEFHGDILADPLTVRASPVDLSSGLH